MKGTFKAVVLAVFAAQLVQRWLCGRRAREPLAWCGAPGPP
jgi:hypothetical protein